MCKVSDGFVVATGIVSQAIYPGSNPEQAPRRRRFTMHHAPCTMHHAPCTMLTRYNRKELLIHTPELPFG